MISGSSIQKLQMYISFLMAQLLSIEIRLIFITQIILLLSHRLLPVPHLLLVLLLYLLFAFVTNKNICIKHNDD